MKVLQIQQLGSLDDIEIVEIDSPELAAGQIRVAVLASGLNYVDSLMIEGKYQIKPPVPYRPGSEIVGRVVEVASFSVQSRSFGQAERPGNSLPLP